MISEKDFGLFRSEQMGKAYAGSVFFLKLETKLASDYERF